MSERRLLGGLLAVLGAVALIAWQGGMAALPGAVWLLATLFAAGAVWLRGRGRIPRWQRVGAVVLLALAGVAGAGRLVAAAPLAFLALAFVLAFLSGRRRAWTILPAGVLGTLALIVAADELLPRWETAPLLFLGFAATFSLLYLLPRPEGGGRRWALYPALFFLVMTVVVNDPGRGFPSWLLPVLLIGGGVSMLLGWRGER